MMDQRTKILAALFAAAIGYAAVSQIVYPRWIKPYLTLDEKIAERRKELERLEKLEERVKQARKQYKTYLARDGAFDIETVQTDVWDRLNGLIDRYGLQNVSVTPGRPRTDRKTDIESKTLSVSATGTLESTIHFLREISEFPHLFRVGSVSLSPSRSRRTRSKEELMSMRVPLELIALPPHRLVGNVDEETLQQPDALVRHQQRDYSAIWARTPFTEYIPPPPLVVSAGSDERTTQGVSLTLRATVRGGVAPYRFEWKPEEGLSSPRSGTTLVDTKEPFTRTYTLTVSDDSGQTASDDVTVTVAERVARSRQPPPPPPPPADKRWRDRGNMQFVMALGRHGGVKDLEEVMVYNTRTRETTYYAPGDEFDGGELVFVHQTGALVHRNDEYAVYPIGARLDQDIPLKNAEDFPELKAAAERHRSEAKASQAPRQGSKESPAEPDAARMRTVSDRVRP